jgi:hypothetical protein
MSKSFSRYVSRHQNVLQSRFPSVFFLSVLRFRHGISLDALIDNVCAPIATYSALIAQRLSRLFVHLDARVNTIH